MAQETQSEAGLHSSHIPDLRVPPQTKYDSALSLECLSLSEHIPTLFRQYLFQGAVILVGAFVPEEIVRLTLGTHHHDNFTTFLEQLICRRYR